MVDTPRVFKLSAFHLQRSVKGQFRDVSFDRLGLQEVVGYEEHPSLTIENKFQFNTAVELIPFLLTRKNNNNNDNTNHNDNNNNKGTGQSQVNGSLSLSLSFLSFFFFFFLLFPGKGKNDKTKSNKTDPSESLNHQATK